LFRLYNAHEFFIWNSNACLQIIRQQQLAACEHKKTCGTVVKATIKKARLQGDQGKSPYSALAWVLLLFLAGIFVKFAATTPIFHCSLELRIGHFNLASST
jgi:hypothetical protein